MYASRAILLDILACARSFDALFYHARSLARSHLSDILSHTAARLACVVMTHVHDSVCVVMTHMSNANAVSHVINVFSLSRTNTTHIQIFNGRLLKPGRSFFFAHTRLYTNSFLLVSCDDIAQLRFHLHTIR